MKLNDIFFDEIIKGYDGLIREINLYSCHRAEIMVYVMKKEAG